MSDWQDIKKKVLADKKTKAIYDSLDVDAQLAQGLINLRIKKKLTQAEFAKKLETTQSVVARLESGKANPTLSSLVKIASKMGVELRISFV